MLVWDNQQAINWFVGILEGEGHFHKYNENSIYVEISNTDIDIIQACKFFLKSKSILFSVREQSHKRNKKMYRIYVRNVDCHNLYNVIEQSLQGRREEFQQILSASTTLREITVSLDWLIGIFEGEGSICLTKSRGLITPLLDIVNTNPLILKRVVQTLKS